MTKGKVIVIEGIDGVGKNTQATLLSKYISTHFGACGLFSFPRYETETGKQVAKYLRGELGTLSLEARAKLYADDRLAAKEEMLSFLNKGIDVVCDRYIHSNTAFLTSLAKIEGKNDEEINALEKYLFDAELLINEIPQIDKLIVLTLPSHLSEYLVRCKAPRGYTADKKDLHEKQEQLQNLANAYYNKFANDIIYCSDNDDQIKPVEVIHDLVVAKYLQLKGDPARWLI